MTITLEAIRAAGGIVHSDGNIFFRDISMLQGLAGAAPAAVAPQGEYPQLPKPAGRIELVDHPGGINTCGPLTHTADAYTSAQMRAYFDLGRQPEAVAVPAISDEDRMTLAGALGLLRGHRYDGSADALQRVLDADAAAPALEAPAAPVLHDIDAGVEVMAWLRENRAPHSIYSKMSACLFGDPDKPRAALAAAPQAPAAPAVDAPPLDVCTDPYNCARCKTHPAHRGDMHHAGISGKGGSA